MTDNDRRGVPTVAHNDHSHYADQPCAAPPIYRLAGLCSADGKLWRPKRGDIVTSDRTDTPATTQQLQQAALGELEAAIDETEATPAAADAAYYVARAQAYATLAVAAAVREANADSALRAIANGLNELRVTV